MITDNPDTNSRPAESPSSRPMTLRQQLEAIRTPVKWQDGKVIEYDSIGNDDVIDEILNLFDIYGQEIAREAHRRGYKSGHAKGVFTNTKQRRRTVSRNICPVCREKQEVAELTHPDTTAAGNDLPSYDPKADIEARLRRKGQLTQKPEEDNNA